ncbi:MAG TPA: FHA domain-containing protein [Polyangiaceae bacterium]|nr:FHA domain-containing protein [Polyangiaceae bacterium]
MAPMDPKTVTHELRRFVAVPTLGVEVVEGPDQGRVVTVDHEILSVGTADRNDLVVSDHAVSRYHLELVRLDRGVRVVDLGSTNGTFVANVQLERGVVQPGSVLTIGQTRLNVRGGEQTTVPLYDKDHFGGLLGRTPVMRRLMARLAKVATKDVAVLLIGESGTGKEVIARALHEGSARADGPFVTVDCGALSPHLVATELFGHERGAFTGAERTHQGAFELADGGTLFLDEIGELPKELQSYLLGAIERRMVRRVGGESDLEVDVRIVSATNRDLRSEVNAGRFRLDLFHRIAVASFQVPPLRERPDDIPLLVERFLSEIDPRATLDEVAPADVLARLAHHGWPGNVRELRNLVEASLAMGETLEIGDDSLAATTPDTVLSMATLDRLAGLTYRNARRTVVEAFERGYLTRLLERTQGNVSQAAREARMNRSHLSEVVNRLGLR